MKILIVDDHAIVRAGLRRLLAEEARLELREAANGREAIGICRDWRPDLVILDLNLPGLGGLELIKRLRLEEKAPRILVLSLHDDPLHAMRALQAGAAGYVDKNAAPAEILEGIRRVGEGQSYVAPRLAQELALFSVRAPAHPLADLSPRDLDILRLLGEGRSLQEIADALGLGYKTIANSCGQLKAKLGVQRTAELIRIAVETKIASESGA
ncbi:MAG TPA: response regulator transcription factor [Stellaceae bacterium]|nr:response regulator transcription factor [Stellaceae bacterium]